MVVSHSLFIFFSRAEFCYTRLDPTPSCIDFVNYKGRSVPMLDSIPILMLMKCIDWWYSGYSI